MVIRLVMPICPLCNINVKNPGYCSQCNKEYHKQWYKQNLQRERKKSKIYSQEYRKIHKEHCREYQREYQKKLGKRYKLYLLKWRKKNVSKIKKYNEKYREKNKEKQKLWSYAYYYLRDKMIKEIGKCQKCGSQNQLELHHIEYNNNPKSIRLLCRVCHQGEHLKNEHS